MATTITRECTSQDVTLFRRNAWKYLSIRSVHIRIHGGDTDVSCVGPTPRYTATIEVLDARPQESEVAEPEIIDAVLTLFGSNILA